MNFYQIKLIEKRNKALKAVLPIVLFLTGVNVGFMPAGNYLGGLIANLAPYTTKKGRLL